MLALPFAAAASGAHSAAQSTAFLDTLSAKACILIDGATGKKLFELNSGEKLPAAGLSRLAALLVICDAFDSGEADKTMTVTISDEASSIGGTTAFLRPNERISADKLLMAAVMINAGDAIHALACAAFGSETAAIQRINARLNGLGLEGGLGDICGRDRSFSAAELAAIGSELIKSETYSQYGTMYYELLAHEAAGDTELANPNKLIRQYSGCLGVGTGSSVEAGYCGVFAAKRGETVFIAAVLGAENSADRFKAGTALLDHGFANFRSVRVGEPGDAYGSVAVRGALKNEVEAVSEGDTVLLIRTSSGKYTVEPLLPPFLTAPVDKTQPIGKLIVRDAQGEVLEEAELFPAEDVEAAGFGGYMRWILLLFTGKIR